MQREMKLKIILKTCVLQPNRRRFHARSTDAQMNRRVNLIQHQTKDRKIKSLNYVFL